MSYYHLILPGVLVSVVLEVLDLWDDFHYFGHFRWAASARDIVNTSLIPFLLVSVCRYAGVSTGKDGRTRERTSGVAQLSMATGAPIGPLYDAACVQGRPSVPAGLGPAPTAMSLRTGYEGRRGHAVRWTPRSRRPFQPSSEGPPPLN